MEEFIDPCADDFRVFTMFGRELYIYFKYGYKEAPDIKCVNFSNTYFQINSHKKERKKKFTNVALSQKKISQRDKIPF